MLVGMQLQLWKRKQVMSQGCKATEKATPYLPVENPSLFQHISKVDVGIKKVLIQLDSLKNKWNEFCLI